MELLQHELDLGDLDTYVHAAPLDLTGLWSVYAADRPDLKYPLYQAMAPRRLHDDEGKPMDIFGVLRRGDVLLHHPYDSFSSTVEEFVRQAWELWTSGIGDQADAVPHQPGALDPASLCWPPRTGERVVALVEVKAGFDESRNIEWARRLEQAGVHVVYGIVGLKTHSKVSLVVRGEGDGVGLYCHFKQATTTTARPHVSTRTSACSPRTPTSVLMPASSSTTSPASVSRSKSTRWLPPITCDDRCWT